MACGSSKWVFFFFVVFSSDVLSFVWGVFFYLYNAFPPFSSKRTARF